MAPGVTEEEATAFFADSVFIGDSVMMGFRNYVMYQQSQGNTGCMSSPTFLVSGSLSARTSLSSISDSSLHPLYKGQKRLIEDVIAEIGAKKVFILFGLNEVAVNGTEEPIRYLDTLISRILAQSPEVEIYLVSTTYMVQGSELEKLNNRNIRILNSNRRAYADALGYGYIDIANNVCDENGYLPSSYSSDQYVHQNYTSYAIWEDVLLSYASYNIAAEKGGAHAE
ncbi:MAG: GDSL-type esterase/lipase family protein [Clostridiaceae bacterium]|nr:GDSL-type esterase/lipase family protein [Clostridiaceae bacterium]